VSETSDGPVVQLPADLPGLTGLRPLSRLGGDAGSPSPGSVAPDGRAGFPPSPAAVADERVEPVEPAGDEAWSTVFGATDVGSRPYCATVDGDVVYLGGDFTGVMAGMPQDTYLRIARWDGRSWSRLGDGLDGTVRAICVVGGSVFVGGEFSIAGGTVAAARLARWDGQTWSDVSGGVALADVPSMAVVRALASDGERLYVAGRFDRVGRGDTAAAASGLAVLDLATQSWSTYGAGLADLGSTGEGRALLLDEGRLYVGGRFDTAGGSATGSLASVDTATGAWTSYGAGIRDGEFIGQVESLALDPDSGSVYVGGSFTMADTVPASGVVRLDGAGFTSLGEFTFYDNASTASVKALAVSGGQVYAGGEFTTAGNSAAANWVVLRGTEWSAPWERVDNVVQALAAYGSGVVVAGDFVSSGSLRVTHAGIWTGERWQTFGQGVSYDPYADGNVYAVSPSGDGAYVAGYFDQAGPLRVGSIARWTGTEWDPVGHGVAAANGLGKICAAAQLGNDLYVTGSFASAGDSAAANIARWDGNTWSPVGSGLNGTGYALAVLGGNLYVGGDFTAAGTTTASGVAMWDPAAGTWNTLGNAPVFDDDVLGLAVIADRYVVIGGEYNAFRRGGRDLVRGLNGMVLFDTQAQIDPADPTSGYYVLAGVKRSSGTGTVRALQVLAGDLYVGGSFDTAGVLDLTSPQESGFAAQNLAVWHFGGDGTWSTPGGADQPVQALATLDGSQLVLAGWFSIAGSTRAKGVATYDPATASWGTFGSGLGEGLSGVLHGEALAQHPGAGTWVGGTFNTAGGSPSCGIALWTGTAGRQP
jgi:trimeric autotransporter adhesin